jgi:hypothetical protein
MEYVGMGDHIHPQRSGSPFFSWMAPSTWCNVISRTISLYPTAVLSSNTRHPQYTLGPVLWPSDPGHCTALEHGKKCLLFACAVKLSAFSAGHGVCQCRRTVEDFGFWQGSCGTYRARCLLLPHTTLRHIREQGTFCMQ